MATVDKNFKVKNGLIVEGDTATVAGSDIITEDIITSGTQTNITVTYDAVNKQLDFVAENGVANSTTDDLVEGSTNLYYTDARVDAYINASIDTGDVSEGSNLYYTDQRVDEYINASIDTDDVSEGVTNLYFTDERAQDAVGNAVGTGLTYDDNTGTIGVNSGEMVNKVVNGVSGNSYGIVGNATYLDVTNPTAYNSEIDIDIAALESKLTTDGYSKQSDIEAHSDLTTGVHGVTGDVVGTSDAQALTNKTLGTGTQLTADLDANSNKIVNVTDPTANQDAATKIYVDTKVADLVDGAPALLDTLNELAAAIGDDENFVTSITTSIGEKVAKAGDTMTGALVLSGDPTLDLHAATKQYVDQAETDAVSTAANYTDSAIETGDATATPIYQALNVNDVAKQVAATVGAFGSVATTAYSWAAADYRTAKFLVKVAYGTHTEVSEVLLTLDTADNIAITEYAIVGTNGSLATVSATTDGTDVDLIVTPGNDSTITVYGTLLV